MRMSTRDEPQNVKDILVEMKDTSELMIDLAYSAVMYSSKEMADEVLELEDHMNHLQKQAHIILVLSGRNREEAEQLQSIFNIVAAAEKISDAADDIATVVNNDLPVPDALRAALTESQETTARFPVASDTGNDGMTVKAFESGVGAGTRIIAVRRNGDWVFDPVDETHLTAEDTLFVRGPQDSVKNAYSEMTGDTFTPDHPKESESDHGLAETLIEMKDVMELATGLAYGAVLFNNRELAEEVLSLESRTDTMREQVETEILTAASQDSIADLRGAYHIATASEVITDAAMEIATAVMDDTTPHPVLQEANRESDETILQTVIEDGSTLVGREISDTPLETDLGMTVIAVKQGTSWEYSPSTSLTLGAGDMIIARGPREHRAQAIELGSGTAQ